MLRQHAKVKERDARSVKINKRFTKLLIAEEPEAERARRSDTHTFNRLFGRDEEGERRLTVVLQGPAGIGQSSPRVARESWGWRSSPGLDAQSQHAGEMS